MAYLLVILADVWLCFNFMGSIISLIIDLVVGISILIVENIIVSLLGWF